MKRRTFLIGAAAVAGGLAVGWRQWRRARADDAIGLVQKPGETLLGGWIKIGHDDVVTAYVPHVDMGQGIYTALAMMVAEELDADWAQMRAERAPGEKAFANRFLAEGWILQGFTPPRALDGAVDLGFGEAARMIGLQITGGSTAMRFTGQMGLALVAAATRQALVEAAGRRWQVPAGDIVTAGGIARHAASGRSARYGELAADAAGLGLTASPRLKPRDECRLIGTSVPRLDIPAKVDGRLRYGIDLALPGMLHAAIKASPVPGGRLERVDAKGHRVVELPDAVAVIAEHYWQAARGLAALEPVFGDAGLGKLSSAGLMAQQRRALTESEGTSLHKAGDAAAALAGAARVVEAQYEVPYLHHAAMEPINVTAQFADGQLTVWGGEQDALLTKLNLVKASGLPEDRVTVVPTAVGGAFGRRIVQDARHVDQAVALARAVSPRPVKLIWSREEDFTQGTYRPALTSTIRATLGADGRPLAWDQRFIESPGRNEAWSLPYAIPHQSIRAVPCPAPIRLGTWRSVAHTQHGFYTECFIDELAHAAGQDPYRYRRGLLPAGSRHVRVLDTAAGRAGWGGALPAGHGRGIALVEAFGTIVAHVVEASMGRDGMPVVHRVVSSIDCGDVCHPDTAAQQVEGAILMGLGAAMAEEITISGGAVVQRNFPDYPIMTMARTPPVIELHFLRSDSPWGGLGEPGVPPAAPALANALFAATGQRRRRLPLRDVA